MGWTLQEDKALSGVQRRIVKVKRRVAAGQPPLDYTPLPSSSSHSGSQAYDQTGSQALRQMLNIGGAASHDSTTRSANQRSSSHNLPDSLDLDKLHISADHGGSSRAASAPAAAANVSQWPGLLSPVSPTKFGRKQNWHLLCLLCSEGSPDNALVSSLPTSLIFLPFE